MFWSYEAHDGPKSDRIKKWQPEQPVVKKVFTVNANASEKANVGGARVRPDPFV